MSKRIFISFAIEDERLRDFLVAQAHNDNSPFEFVDMSVKEPWSESVWKDKCRTRIKGCDGMIVFITNNTPKASGQHWEIKCAKEENIPYIGIWGYHDQHNYSFVPSEMKYDQIYGWTWNNLNNWIKGL